MFIYKAVYKARWQTFLEKKGVGIFHYIITASICTAV